MSRISLSSRVIPIVRFPSVSVFIIWHQYFVSPYFYKIGFTLQIWIPPFSCKILLATFSISSEHLGKQIIDKGIILCSMMNTSVLFFCKHVKVSCHSHNYSNVQVFLLSWPTNVQEANNLVPELHSRGCSAPDWM